ncbi:MAG: AAA family ATPase [Planctomycetes bacterium]|nr:AAA family ATPase [Planctomycetota bacterium]
MEIAIPSPGLVILCGPAACGKSTFARRHFRPTQVVSSDRCRAMLTDSAGAQWASGQAFELFHTIIEKRLALGRLTVADSTALSKTARRDLNRIAKAADTPVVLIIFNVSKDTCLERDGKRRRRVGEDVVAAHIEKLDIALKETRNERYHAVYILDEKEMDRAQVSKTKNQGRRDS